MLILYSDESARFSTRAVGERLRQMRRTCGASQKDLAKAIGIGVATLRGYETGRIAPLMGHLKLAAEALSLEFEYLLWGGGEPICHSEVSQLRLSWKLRQLTPPGAARVLELVDGILAQSPTRGQGLAAVFRAAEREAQRNAERDARRGRSRKAGRSLDARPGAAPGSEPW